MDIRLVEKKRCKRCKSEGKSVSLSCENYFCLFFDVWNINLNNVIETICKSK